MTFILYLGNVLLLIQTLARLLKKNYLHTAERRVTEIKRSFHNPPTMKLVYDMPREKGDNFHTECKTNEILKLHVQCIAFIDMFALFLFYLLPHTAKRKPLSGCTIVQFKRIERVNSHWYAICLWTNSECRKY